MCNRALLCFIYRFNLLYFPPFQRLFSASAHARGERQFSIDYSTIKVMVILNNMTWIEYSWKWWLTYSQFRCIMVWPPADTSWKVNNECGARGKRKKLVYPFIHSLYMTLCFQLHGDIVLVLQGAKGPETELDWIRPSHESLQRDVEKEKRARQEVSIYLGKEVPLVIPSHPSARLLRQRAVTETHRCTSLGMSSK